MPEDEIEQILNSVGEQIFTDLAAVAEAAKEDLSGSAQPLGNTLVRPTNTMVGQARPERNITEINSAVRDDLRRLLREPFVARVEVDWGQEGKPETYYFSRPSVAGMARALPNAKLVTSRAALGHLAEHEAGESVAINGREGYIVSRSVFSPSSQEGIWDVLVRKFESMPWGDALQLLRHESLRQALEEIRRGRAGPVTEEDILGLLEQEAAAAEFERHRVRRKVVDRIALRDQPSSSLIGTTNSGKV